MFLLAATLLFPLVWFLLHFFTDSYNRLLVGGLEVFFQAAGKRIRLELQGEALYFRLYISPFVEGRLSPTLVFTNLPLFVTLCLATPGMRLWRRVLMVLGGGFLLYLTHLFFLATKLQISLIELNHPGAGSRWWWVGADNFFEVMGKAFFPLLIWLLFALPYMLGRVDERVPAAPSLKVKRNAPCPCGSGLKYKRCCGAP